MMQSRLLNSANKPQASERLLDAATSDPKSKNTKQQALTCFSDVLGVALEEHEVDASRAVYIAEADTDIDGELLSDTLSAESSADNTSVDDLDESLGLQSADELQYLDALDLSDGTANERIENAQVITDGAANKSIENAQVIADGAANESIGNEQALADVAANKSIENELALADVAANESIENEQALAGDAANENIKNEQALADGAASESIENEQGLADSAGIKNAQDLLTAAKVDNVQHIEAPVTPSADLVSGKVTPNTQDNVKEELDPLPDLTEDTGAPGILAQIQAAQKIDTQVNEPAKAAEESLAPLAGIKKDHSATIDKSAAAAASGALTDDEKAEKTTQKETKSDALPIAESKLQPFLSTNTSNNEGHHAVTPPIDGIGLHSANMNSTHLDKLINQNGHNTAPLAAQQPALDLQAKHASALLGERVLMMINEGKQEVQIRLDPAELGSMFVKLQMHNDQLQLSIQTQVGQSRDIIEQHLPKLREQLAQQGVNLGEANVEQQNQQQQNQQQKNAIQHNSARVAGDSALASSSEEKKWHAASIDISPQGVDYYA